MAVETTNAGFAIPPLLHFAFRRIVRPLGFEPRCRRPQFLRLLRKPFRQGRKLKWAWRDSNSHVRRRQFLRLVCMQFHHRPVALRGRFERPIVGLEATRVTIRIRSTLVGRAGFEPARFSRKVTGATAQRLRPTHPSPRCQRTYTNIWLGGRPARRTPTCRGRLAGKPAGIADIPRLPGRQLPIQ